MEKLNNETMSKINYSRFINALSLARKASPIRVLTEILSRSPASTISMAGGLPNTKMFPFKDITINLKDGKSIALSDKLLENALQYGPTPGIPVLLSQLKKMQLRLHNPPTQNSGDDQQLDVIVTNGSQDGLCKLMEMFLKPNDYIITEQPTYAGALVGLQPMKIKFLPVQTDDRGLIPAVLRQVLSKWSPADCKNLDCIMPKILYLIPNGANPTGASLTLERKKEIYKIAQDYDLLIIEDDPYYFLQFSEVYTPSFLSMDVDGRVIRLDSFSKVLSAGLRVGFMTGPKSILERVNYHMQVSVMHASSLSQMIVSELLKLWGEDGWNAHISSIRSFYTQQKDNMMKYAKKWLTGLAEWHEPSAGMFMWIKILGLEDTRNLIHEKAIHKEILLLPGYSCSPDYSQPSPYLRAAFSFVTPEDMDKGFERLAALIKEEVALQKKE